MTEQTLIKKIGMANKQLRHLYKLAGLFFFVTIILIHTMKSFSSRNYDIEASVGNLSQLASFPESSLQSERYVATNPHSFKYLINPGYQVSRDTFL